MDDILADIVARQPSHIYQDYLLEYQYKMKIAKDKKDLEDLEKAKKKSTEPCISKFTQLEFDLGE